MPLAEYLSPENLLTASTLGIFIGIIIFVLYKLIIDHLEKNPIKFSLKIIKEEISYFSIIVVISAILANILLYKFGNSLKIIPAAFFTYSMLLLAAVDFKTQLLPDIITKPLIILGIIQAYFEIFTDFKSSLIGAFAGYFVLWSVNTIFRMVRGIDGMGYGDFKLLAAIGAWAGFKILPLTILFSSIIGIFIALIIIKTTKQDMQAPTPFGPSLVITGFIAFLYGNDILNWYISMLQFH